MKLKHLLSIALAFALCTTTTAALAGDASASRQKTARGAKQKRARTSRPAASKPSTGPAATASTEPSSERSKYVSPPMPSNWDGGFFTPSPNVQPHPRSGVYAIWYSGKPELLDLPFIKGGQVMELWADLDKGNGQYDFSPLDKKLDELAKRNMATTIQVNGGRKPAWMFEKVPYFPRRDGKAFAYQVEDKKGTLMYWHPTFIQAYLDFIKAFADHIRQSPHRDLVLGVRMNFNAVGTEAMVCPEYARTLEGWIVPPGVDPGEPFKNEFNHAYEEKVLDAFIQNFEGVAKVFVRATISPRLKAKYQDQFDKGTLSWFYTGMSHEAYWPLVYDSFFLDCRSGKTLGYGEPFGDAWGNHGGRRSKRSIAPATAIWWQTLLDLHVGLSFVACYGADLAVAYDGSVPGLNPPSKPGGEGSDEVTTQGASAKKDPVLKDEFFKSFEFGAKYAGYHASPEQSPGAWIALRKTADSDDPMNLGAVEKNDCTFLMKRLPDNSKGVQKVGPAESRFSGYARVLPAGETMKLVLDPIFAKSIAGKATSLNVTYFDGPANAIQIDALGQAFTIDTKNSGQWQTVSYSINEAKGDAINISSADADATLHLIELTREP